MSADTTRSAAIAVLLGVFLMTLFHSYQFACWAVTGIAILASLVYLILHGTQTSE